MSLNFEIKKEMSDIKKLRLFLEGKYIFEEGEKFAEFDIVNLGDVRSSHNYIKSLEDYDYVISTWSISDACIWALDILQYHINKLNAAEINAVINMILEDIKKQ